MSNNETSDDSWEGLLSNYLKAERFEYEKDKVVCIGLNIEGKNMDLEVEYHEEKYLFSLNATNRKFLKEHGVDYPKQVIGKALTLIKVKATNPSTHKDVDSLRICKIE